MLHHVLCFTDDSPTDEAIIERLYWADELAAIVAAHRAAWQARPGPHGMVYEERAYGPDGGQLTIEHPNSTTYRYVRPDGSTETRVTHRMEPVPIVPDGLGSHDVARYHSTFTGGAA